jgi:hypothetical protein
MKLLPRDCFVRRASSPGRYTGCEASMPSTRGWLRTTAPPGSRAGWFCAIRTATRRAGRSCSVDSCRLRQRECGLQIAVHASEAWLLADAESLSDFLSVARTRVPSHPESVSDPKRAILSLAQRSRKRAVREALVPAHGDTARVGPGHGAALIDYRHAALASGDRCALLRQPGQPAALSSLGLAARTRYIVS